jgi:hypothetical protein
MVVGGDCDDNEGQGDDNEDNEGDNGEGDEGDNDDGDERLGFDIEIFSWNERFKVVAEIESSGHRAHNLLRYGSWGEPCACILWYREERRRKSIVWLLSNFG